MAGTDKGKRTNSGGRRRSSSGGGGSSGKREEKTVVRRGGRASGVGVKAKYDAPSKRSSGKTNDSRRLGSGDDKKGGPVSKKGDGRRNKRGGNPAPRVGNAQKIKGRGKPKEKAKPMTAEELDASMDDYWMKSKDNTVASKKLDEDMDAYWAKKGDENSTNVAAADDDAKEEAKA